VVEHRRGKGRGVVAVVTGIGAGDVVGRLAGCRAAVVAAEAGAQHVGMIDPDCRHEAGRAVAVLARAGGLDMRAVLAGCRSTVVARRTVAAHTAVVEHRRGEGAGVVAVIAGVGTGNVIE